MTTQAERLHASHLASENSGPTPVPHVVSRPWDGSHPPPAPTLKSRVTLLGDIVRAGLDAHRTMPDNTARRFNLTESAASQAEYARNERATNERMEARIALRELLEIANGAPNG